MQAFSSRSATVHLFCGAMLLLAGCGAPPATAGSCGLALAAGHSDDDAIRAVIEAEGRLVVIQEIDALMALWDEDAFVANAKNTPNTADDQFWRGQDAIRHRYVRTVFPGAPTAAAPPELAIHRDGARAIVTATTRIGSEVAPAGDRWVLIKRDGCWQIESLTYNLEAAQPE
jgi:ketosteroid isomerase-like protein